VRELLQDSCTALELEIATGHPAEILVREAAERQADLIVLGARGHRGVLDVLLGGVAQQVTEHAHCPVLLSRAPVGELRKVLLAVDGSDCSRRAVEYLAGFNLPVETEVVVTAVAPPPGLGGMGMNAWPAGQELVPVLSDRELAELEKIREDEKARLREAQAQAVSCLVEAGKPAETVLLEGDPAAELIKYARAHHVDLIAAGSRGLSAVRGWIMGSVSHKLVNYSGRSVMIIRGSFCDDPRAN
jgi:nucleotide-binding universal stress UspA family protein